jgi:hypothetical protein
VTTHLSRFHYYYSTATRVMSVYIVMLCWYDVSYYSSTDLLMFTLSGMHVWNECSYGRLFCVFVFDIVFLGFFSFFFFF